MSEGNSSHRASASNPSKRTTGVSDTRKPKKPYPDFPLFPHATKRWAKKIRGKMHYFGAWDDPDGALNKYLEQRDDLHAGRKPRVESDGLTVRDLVNRFLTSKTRLKDSGELKQRTLDEYVGTCDAVIAEFGANRLVDDLAAEDFERLRALLAERLGPVRLANEIQRTRSLFKYGYDDGLIEKPVRYGQQFKKPSKKVMRLHRASGGKCMFAADEIRKLLDEATVPMRAMILVGINCGFGNNDCATLPLAAADLQTGWVDHTRPKTGIVRRCPLWPETVDAIADYVKRRTSPKDPEHVGLLFVTKYGGAWGKEIIDSPVAKEMSKLLKSLSINGRRRLGFYALRHTFETVGGESRDQVAVNAIMGHADESMAAVYRENISDERLQAVTDFVRRWLFAARDDRKTR